MDSITRCMRAEHERVRKAVACLDALAREVLSGRPLRVQDACALLRYFELVVDRMHQDKEERVLFPALLRTGQLNGRVIELICEHDAERASLTRLQRAAAEVDAEDPGGQRCFALLAREYCRAQSEHADKEDQVLLPLADELLDEEDQLALSARCAAIDFEYGLVELEELTDEMEALALRLDVAAHLPGDG